MFVDGIDFQIVRLLIFLTLWQLFTTFSIFNFKKGARTGEIKKTKDDWLANSLIPRKFGLF